MKSSFSILPLSASVCLKPTSLIRICSESNLSWYLSVEWTKSEICILLLDMSTSSFTKQGLCHGALNPVVST